MSARRLLPLAAVVGLTSVPAVAGKASPPPVPIQPIYYGRPATVAIDAAHPIGRLRFGARSRSAIRITSRRDDAIEALRGRLGLKLYRLGTRAKPKLLAEAESVAPGEDVLTTLLKEPGQYLIEVAATAGSQGAPIAGATVAVTLACGGKNDLACALAAQPGSFCGPREPCDGGLVCKPTEGCRGGGSCIARPAPCPPSACRTSCGCDGNSYCGECEAERAGTFLDHPGVCTGKPCGPTVACGPADYCSFPTGACRRIGAQGVCKARPESCPTAPRPVCGCDGRTYPSECAAAVAGTAVATPGACGRSEVECRATDECKGLLPEICEVCRDGQNQTACAHFVCRDGRCITEVCPR